MYEGQLDQLQSQTFNMENAALTTENLRNTMATVDAMKQANKEMKRQYGKLDIDKIEVCFHFLLCQAHTLLVNTLRHGGSNGTSQRNTGKHGKDVRRAGRSR